MKADPGPERGTWNEDELVPGCGVSTIVE
jgi:hypothetical protein